MLQHETAYNDRWNRYLFWYVLFVVFPAVVVFQNLSFYFFLLLFVTTMLHEKPIRLKFLLQWVSIAFGIAAVISVLDVNVKKPDALSRALVVLPNYLYWVLLILFLVTHRLKIRLVEVYRASFFGVICAVLYYFFFQHFLNFFPFVSFPQNSFAFLIICYSPIATFYCSRRFGFAMGLALGIVLAVSAFLGGSRAGSILTFCGVFLTLLSDRLNFKVLIILGCIVGFFGNALLDIDFVKNGIRALNEETYELIYDRNNVLKTDRSFLVRVAMVEKGLELYQEHPLTGIGLNNFSNIEVNIPGNFEGAIYVKNKDIFETKSAHNSYIGLLAEGGVLLLAPFLLLLIGCIIFFLRYSSELPPSFKPVFIGIMTMSIHLYFITAIVNVFAWLLLGLGTALIYKHTYLRTFRKK